VFVGTGGTNDPEIEPVAHNTNPRPALTTDPHAGHAFVYLDGQAVDVDDVPEAELLEGLRPAQPDAASDDDGDDGLLNSPGLAWVDNLDNAKLDRLETALPPAPSGPPKKGS
jgi:hypothetical protein